MKVAHVGDREFLLWAGLSSSVAVEHVIIATTRGGPAPWWWMGIALVAVTGAVALRRDRPHLALGVVGALVVARILWALPYEAPFPISYGAALALVSWLAGRVSQDARRITQIVVAGNLGVLVLGIPLRGDTAVSFLILNWIIVVFWSLLLVVLPWLLGRLRRQQVLLASAGWERAERMEHEQRLLLEQARLRERTLIAQDMHDSLGHELSLIALRAGALEVADDVPDRHQRAAGELRASAATATDRLAEIIGVLREQDGSAPLTPVGEGVAALVERAASSGMDVRLITEGVASDVPTGVGRAVHRVVREGLTNATKHAAGAAVLVRVRHERDVTTVSVVNGPTDGPAGSVEGAEGTGGHGLRGLRERLDILGGSIRTAGTGDGGHELVARIPHDPDPAAADSTPADPRGSTSAAERATARRTARRGLLVTVLVPPAMVLTVGAVYVAYYVGSAYVSILEPSDYQQLRIGQSRAEMEDVLPPLEMVDAPIDNAPSPAKGATCEFYRPDGPFSITFAYRLCFDDGVLVSKDVFPTGSRPPDLENP